ncbi:hypothetical protein UCRPC4_g02989 [Phaeomoniella chlamydospora]|uniref:Protein kinase domain-containing protein n=1 Tax=Phaeomoniella chlamydospora TaxID=158046 RepID=A0A0G2EKW1_PHACM|nr:hypothetical protein UCRPC4_g02989 [Phaeomoniella chlamydospora]
MRSELASPHTPQDNLVPPDPSGLSISAHNDQPLFYNAGSSSTLPATPTAPREYFTNFGNRPSLVLAGPSAIDVDASLTSRFEKAELVGTGEFSLVYRVTKQPEASPFHPAFSLTASRSSSQASLPERVWAVKKSKYSYSGAKDRQKKIHEVDVLKTLGLSDHIVSFVDSWEERGHLYIQTEFCEEGSMDDFLTRVGMQGRLDDFRIWKILLELSLGLKHIHDHGFIHLDIKPANILITFEGVLKIADFGMAAKWPAKAHIEGEGDREYIGPEILKGQYDKPADIFALGLIMVETAGNVSLPDNGTSWQKLRNGDLSDVPSLTWSSENSNATRDISGNGLDKEPSFEEMRDVSGVDDAQLRESPSSRRSFRGKKSTTHITREGELTEPPTWMIDPNSEHGLERIIRWMISPHPGDRPRVDEVLQTFGVQFADSRRRAGATIFEGNWGPADEVLAEDAEMIDV